MSTKLITCAFLILQAISCLSFCQASSYSSHQYPPPPSKYYAPSYEKPSYGYQAAPSYEYRAPSWAKHSQYDNYDPKYEAPMPQHVPSYPLNPEPAYPSAPEYPQHQHQPEHSYMAASYDQSEYPLGGPSSYSGHSPYPQTKQQHHRYRSSVSTRGHHSAAAATQIPDYQHQLEPSYVDHHATPAGHLDASQYESDSSMLEPSQYESLIGPESESGMAHHEMAGEYSPSEFKSGGKA